MDQKVIVHAEIDRLVAEYEAERDSSPITLVGEDAHHKILGAIKALKTLKETIQGFGENLETERFFDFVKQECDQIPETDAILGCIGSASPKAMPGRIEAMQRIKNFVQELSAQNY